MNNRKVTGVLIRSITGLIGLFFLLMAFLQFQDEFVGYAFVSLGLSSLILFFTFRKVFRKRKDSREF
jgi:hypothetical protein